MKTVIILAILVAMITSARAQTSPDRAKAKAFYEQATIHYRTGDLERAAAEFKQSYEAYPAAETLFNLAQTYRLLKNNDKAIFYYKQYLSTAELSDSDRQTIAARIIELQAAQSQTKPSPKPSPSSPPSTTIANASAQPTAVTASTSHATRSPWYRSKVGWPLVAVGFVGLGVGAGLIGAAAAEHNSAIGASTQPVFDVHHMNSVRDQQAGWPLLGVGAGIVVAGVIVFVVHAKRNH